MRRIRTPIAALTAYGEGEIPCARMGCFDSAAVDVAIERGLCLELTMSAGRFARPLQLRMINGSFAVTKLPAEMPVPEWASLGPFSSVTRTAGELSIVCEEENVPLNVTSERGFKCLCVAGPLDFSMVGILASLLDPLAEAGVAVFVLSTFDTDYLMVKARDFEACVKALLRAGHRVSKGKDREED